LHKKTPENHNGSTGSNTHMKRTVSLSLGSITCPGSLGMISAYPGNIPGFGTPLRCGANITRFFDFTVLK
jgi:hypothetical protein